MMGYDVVALGELLVDFAPAGFTGQGNPCFEANPGGAPCNVLAMLAGLGCKTAFIGKVGTDMHGRRLAQVVQQAGIDTAGLVLDKEVDTTLAFVQLNEEGDRDFSFFRRPGADTMLTPQEVETRLINEAEIFHFGSLSLTRQPARSATVEAVQQAQKAGCVISFDPNLRPPLWQDMQEAKRQIVWGIAQCSVLKLAREELEFVSGITDVQQAARWVQGQFGNIKLLFVTDGKNGAQAFAGGNAANYPTYTNVKTIDTTGAGDTFMGCCLYGVLQKGVAGWAAKDLQELLRFANAAASLITTKKGAICSMPSLAEVEALMKEYPQL